MTETSGSGNPFGFWQLFSRMEELTADDADSADGTRLAATSLPEHNIRVIREIRGLLHSA
jgi:hypothetical protein